MFLKKFPWSWKDIFVFVGFAVFRKYCHFNNDTFNFLLNFFFKVHAIIIGFLPLKKKCDSNVDAQHERIELDNLLRQN